MFKIVNESFDKETKILTTELESQSGRKYWLVIEPSFINFDDVCPEEQTRLFESNGNYTPLEAYDRLDGERYYEGSLVESEIDELITKYDIKVGAPPLPVTAE